jgi:hypothetical protein
VISLLTALSIAACEQRSGLDGVWEIRGMKTVILQSDSRPRRAEVMFLLDTVRDMHYLHARYVILDDSGRIVDGAWLHEAKHSFRPATLSEDGALLTGIGTDSVRGGWSGCNSFNIFATCAGDTLTWHLARVGDRKDNIPADTVYLARSKSVVYWNSARDHASSGNLENIDSLNGTRVDTAAITYMRAVGIVVRELQMLKEEVERSKWSDTTLRLYPYDVPTKVFGRVGFLRTWLTKVGMDDPADSERARRLLRRLDEVEQEVLRLWRREPQLRVELSAKYRYDFPATRLGERDRQ